MSETPYDKALKFYKSHYDHDGFSDEVIEGYLAGYNQALEDERDKKREIAKKAWRSRSYGNDPEMEGVVMGKLWSSFDHWWEQNGKDL